MARAASGLGLLVLLALVQAFTRAGGALFKRSSELGVTHCALPALLGGDQVTLHTWIRITVTRNQASSDAGACERVGQERHHDEKPACAADVTVRVKGFAILEDPLRSVATIGSGFKNPSWWWLAMLQSRQLVNWNPTFNIRSTRSRKMYEVVIHKPGPNIPPVKTKEAFTQPESQGPTFNTTDLMIDFSGQWTPEPEDADLLEYEFRVEGFRWQCHVLIDQVQSSSINKGREPSIKMKQAENEEGVLDAGSIAHPQAGDIMVKHYQQASLTENTQVVFLMANFHGIRLSTYSRLLYLHVLWHRRMGVTKHLQYMSHSVSDLLAEPLARELVGKRWLEIVMFEELPQHERMPFKSAQIDHYSHQILKYNHAALSHWGKDVLLLVWDLDEYLQTPRPMSVVQMMRECGNKQLGKQSSMGVSVMQLPRRNGYCEVLDETVAKPACEPSKPIQYSRSWHGADVERIEAGLDPHPIVKSISMMARGREFRYDNLKYIMDPSTEPINIYIHTANVSTTKPYEQLNADIKCVRLLHVINLINVRRSPAKDYPDWDREAEPNPVFLLQKAPPKGSDVPSDANWWWPAATGNETP